jgi:DNA-binding MarR family transcriptional regulator
VTAPRWLDRDEDRAWRGYRRLRLLLDLQVHRDLARDSGLSGPDYEVLSNLSETAGHRWRLGDLAARMRWSKSRLSHHIGRMQARGLVTREDCPTDGRGSVIALTERGLGTIEAAAPAHVASVRRHFIDLLSEEQLRTLGDVAETVLAHLAAVDDAAGGPPRAGRVSSRTP